MSPSCHLLRFAVAAGLAVMCALPAMGATSSSDRETQMLANFPALWRLSVGQGEAAVHAYLVRVAKSYEAAGYKAFARELPQADRVVALFGKPDRTKDAGALPEGRKTLRDLEQALSKNAFLVLPTITGKNVPDYFDIGRAFLANAEGALKNLRQGKNVGNFLRGKTATFWVNKQGDHTWQVVSSNAGITVTTTLAPTDGGTLEIGGNGNAGGTGDLVKAGTGTLVLAASNTYTGATTVNAGSLSLTGSTGDYGLGGTDILSGSEVTFNSGAIVGTTYTLINFGSTNFNVGDISWTGFHSGVTGSLTLNGNTFTLTSGGDPGTNVSIGSGATFLPETDFADATLLAHFNGGKLTVAGTTGTHWLVFAFGAALPDGHCGATYFVFDLPYTVNGVDFAAGTQIYRVDDGFVTPDGATELPDAALTAVVDGAATPTPIPSPTP